MKLQFYCTKSKYDLSFEVSKTLKPLAELKVEKKQKKKHFADLRRYTDGGGGWRNSIRGGIRGDVGVPDSQSCVWGVWGFCVWAVSLLPHR